MARKAKAFELLGEIVVDPDKPIRGLRAVERQAKQTTSSIGKMSATMGGGVGGGGMFDSIGKGLQMLPGIGVLAGGLSKVFDVMQGGVRIGFDYRRMIEENTIAFEVMLGSAGAAQKLLKDLASFAETSPFEFSELVPETKKMLAMGFAVEELVPSLRAVSDSASALGSDIGGIILALGQMRQKGKVSAEEMNQLVERGIPAWDILSKAIGKTVKETQKLGERGQLSGVGSAQAILIGMQKRFGGLGEKYATETASGLEANLQDVLARQLGTASGPFFDRYKGLLRGSLDVLNSEATSALARGVAQTGAAGFDTMDAALKLGGDIGAGLIQGVGKTGFNLAGQVISDFAKGIGAQSPATEFIPLGAMAAQGFMIGFQQEMGDDLHALVLKIIEEFKRITGKEVRVSAIGQTATHTKMGWDHTAGVDIAGRGLSDDDFKLISRLAAGYGVPFQYFSKAVPGVATARHGHLGPKSPRLDRSGAYVVSEGANLGGSGAPVPVRIVGGIGGFREGDIEGFAPNDFFQEGKIEGFGETGDAFARIEESVTTLNTEIGRTLQLAPLLPFPFFEAAEGAQKLNTELQQTEPILIETANTWKAAFTGMREEGALIFQQFFMDLDQGWKSALSSMGLAFLEELQRMSAAALASQVWGAILNFAGSAFGGLFGGGKSVGGLGAAMGKSFAGGFASGGYIPPGKWGVVGENGPEPAFGGRTGMQVAPNAAMGGATVHNHHWHITTPNAQSFLARETQSQIQRRARKSLQGAR